jgi:hypothetical protein
MTMEMYRETDKTMYVLVSLILKVKNFLFDFFCLRWKLSKSFLKTKLKGTEK